MLQDNINAEALARSNADTALQESIDVIHMTIDKIMFIPPSNDNQLSILQECIDNDKTAFLLNGTHVINGTLNFTSEHRFLKMEGAGSTKITTSGLIFDGTNAEYRVACPYIYNISFSGKITLKGCAPFTWGEFNNCSFDNTIVLDGSRHFNFNGCLWRDSALALNVADGSRFNGDLNFNGCEFVVNQLAHPYIPTPATPYSEWRGMHFVDCIFYGGGDGSHYIQLDSANLRIMDWYFTQCQFDQIKSAKLFNVSGQEVDKGLKGNFNLIGCTCIFSGVGSKFFSGSLIGELKIQGCGANGGVEVYGLNNAIVTGNSMQELTLQGEKVICTSNVNTAIAVTGSELVVANNLVNV